MIIVCLQWHTISCFFLVFSHLRTSTNILMVYFWSTWRARARTGNFVAQQFEFLLFADARQKPLMMFISFSDKTRPARVELIFFSLFALAQVVAQQLEWPEVGVQRATFTFFNCRALCCVACVCNQLGVSQHCERQFCTHLSRSHCLNARTHTVYLAAHKARVSQVNFVARLRCSWMWLKHSDVDDDDEQEKS